MFFMGGSVGGEYKKIIHIDDEPSFGNHVSKRVIHESLESGEGVHKAKEHDCRFKKALMSDENGLPLMAIFDVHIVVAPTNVELGKDLGIFEFINKVRDQEKGIGVMNSVLVEIPVVLTGSESTIFLFDKEKRSGLGRVQGVDLPSTKVFVKEILGGLAFFGGERIEFPNFWDKKVSKVDLMII